jgi:quaternary ammonium compound-resistance protein SugE
MAWIQLIVAGLLEAGWAVGMKYSEGFERLWPSAFTLTLSTISFVLLARALKDLPIGTGYAIWTGIGAVGVAILGIILFGESASPARLTCIAMIVAGMIGLKLAT